MVVCCVFDMDWNVMDDKVRLMLKQAGFDTGFQNIFIENNSAKLDKFVELIREDERRKASQSSKLQMLTLPFNPPY